MRGIGNVATLALATACVQTQVESGPSPVRAAVAPESVVVFRGSRAVRGRFEEIATVRASGDGRYVGEVQLTRKLREQAARLGGNALIVDTVIVPSPGRVMLGVLIGTTARAEGRAVHLLAPDDTIGASLATRGPVVRAPGHESLVGRAAGGLAPRDRVRVTGMVPARVESARAVVLGSTPDTLLLQFTGGASPTLLPTSSIERLDVLRGRRLTGGRLTAGAVLGAATGALAYVALVEAANISVFDSEGNPDYGRAATNGAIGGTIAGMLYVAMRPGENWLRVR